MPVTLPQLTDLTGTFTVSTVGVLLDLLAPAPAMVVLLALLVQTVLPVQQGSVAHLLTTALLVPAKPLLRLLTTGLTVTSTASMGEKLVGLQAPAPALLATQITTEQVVKHFSPLAAFQNLSLSVGCVLRRVIMMVFTPSWQ